MNKEDNGCRSCISVKSLSIGLPIFPAISGDLSCAITSTNSPPFSSAYHISHQIFDITTSSWINFLVMHGSYNHPVILINVMYIPMRCGTSQNICSRHCLYNDIILSAMASHITSLTIFYSTVYSGADQRKHQSSASLAFVRGIHRWRVNSQHKWPVTRKMFPFDDVIMCTHHCCVFVFLSLDNKVVILYFIFLILSRSLWQSPDSPSSDLKYCAIAFFFQNIDGSCALIFKCGIKQCALCKSSNV